MGDVIGATFNDESEAVLFMPHSGDVMICAATDWLDLANGDLPASATSVSGHRDGGVKVQSLQTTDKLRLTLIHFGANFD